MILPLLALTLSLTQVEGAVRVPTHQLYPPTMHPSTRKAHRRMMASWKSPIPAAPTSPVIFPTQYGADPSGATDSSPAFAEALSALLSRATGLNMSDGIRDLGGVVMDLQGGEYLLSQPLVIPQFVGNMRIIDGTLRAASNFPPAEYLLQVGASPCKTFSGQGSCNENIGMSGLTLDASHIATGCLRIASTMGATLDASSAIFGFNKTGILLQGGHETMISETWVAAYFWSSPMKENTDTVGILISGNDHFLNGVIVFSAKVGVQLNGAANKVVDTHTWNQATGNGGIGILNEESQNIFVGCYLDFTDFVTTSSQQLVLTAGFFLGGAQAVFKAVKASDVVYGVSLSGNVFYDCSGPSYAVDETAGTFASLTDMEVTGTTFCGNSRSMATGVTSATKVMSGLKGSGVGSTHTFDFTNVLLFPSAGIASARVACAVSGAGQCVASILGALPGPGQPLHITVYSMAAKEAGDFTLSVSVDQSAQSAESTAPTNSVPAVP